MELYPESLTCLYNNFLYQKILKRGFNISRQPIEELDFVFGRKEGIGFEMIMNNDNDMTCTWF